MNILDILERENIEMKKVSSCKGGEYHGPCPWCGGVDRFHVWPEQNNGEGSYWCRKCGRVGDLIRFLMEYKKMGFKEACGFVGRSLENIEKKLLAKPKKEVFIPRENRIPQELWQEKAKNFVLFAQEKLIQSKEKISWFANRGIKPEGIKMFGLGYNFEDYFRTRESWGLEPELKENGKPKKLWIPKGVVIPFFRDNRILRVRIRRESGSPKYYFLPGSSSDCFVAPCRNPHFKRIAVVVVESELDAILISQEVGDMVAVVALGSCATKPDKETYKLLNKADFILLSLDFDEAGKKSKDWWLKTFKSKIELFPVPEGKDPGDAYKNGVNIREWVCLGLPPYWKVCSGLENIQKKKTEKMGQKQELLSLMKKYKIKIDLRNGIRLIEPKRFNSTNWSAAKRISALVFGDDPEIYSWLEQNKGKIIRI